MLDPVEERREAMIVEMRLRAEMKSPAENPNDIVKKAASKIRASSKSVLRNKRKHLRNQR